MFGQDSEMWGETPWESCTGKHILLILLLCNGDNCKRKHLKLIFRDVVDMVVTETTIDSKLELITSTSSIVVIKCLCKS